MLENFILTLFAKQTLRTAGLWEDSRGERQQDFALCSMLSPNQGGNDHSKYNIVWTSAKSSWPRLPPAHYAPLWNTLQPLLFRTYSGPGWVGTHPAMYVTSQSSSPCIWQTPAHVEQAVMDHSGATAILRLRCEQHRHRLLFTAFLPRCPWKSSPLPGWRKSEALRPKEQPSRSRTDTGTETAWMSQLGWTRDNTCISHFTMQCGNVKTSCPHALWRKASLMGPILQTTKYFVYFVFNRKKYSTMSRIHFNFWILPMEAGTFS